jgi:WD40 repeat protein/DNA-binding SARP family transcriptional activator
MIVGFKRAHRSSENLSYLLTRGTMARLYVRTLGPFQVQLDEEFVTGFDSDKVRALLAYLVVEADRPHRREKLAGLLWPDFPDQSARTSLRSALANLRKVIGDQNTDTNFILVDRQSLQFNPESNYELDANNFNKLVGSGNDALSDISKVEEAISLYSGDFMEGFSLSDSAIFEEWMLVSREALQRKALQALQHLTGYYQQRGNHDRALELALHQIEMEPFQETAHQQAMWLWALSGRRNEALAHYENFQSTLKAELGVPPLKQTQEMYQQLLDGNIPSPPTETLILRREPKSVGESPYRGLAAFREEDADFYHGRERFVQQLVEALKRRSLVGVILGSSGAGKSSVVHAGLIPRLREEREWLILEFRPGGHPFEALANALVRVLEPNMGEADRLIEAHKLADALISGELPLMNTLEQILTKQPKGFRLLLVLDQFEELYTLSSESENRNQFIDMMIEVAGLGGARQTAPLVLLMTLRADFMGQVLSHRPLADALQDGTFILGPMNREELQAAIQNPAEKQGAAFEAGLVNRILDDVGEEPGNLPLLEFALTLMWEQLDEGWFTHAAYENIGRVEGALARYAEKIYAGLGMDEQEKAKRIFIQLVQPGQGTEDTRRIATRLELGVDNWSLIQELADKRLVVTGRNEDGQETVELVHEAMILGWNRFRRWMDADRGFRIWQEGLRAAIRGWQASDKDEGALLRGAPLTQANAWLEERRIDLSGMEIDYIQVSMALQEKEQLRREKRRRRTIIALASGLLITIILGVFAGGQWRRAEDERDIALSRELAAAASSNLNLDPELSILLAMSAVSEPLSARLPVPREAEEALHTALLSSRLRWTLPGGFGVDFSPDGTLLAADGPDSTAIIWDVSSRHKVLTLAGHSKDVYGVSVHFSPDGKLLATGSADGTAKVWDIATGRELLTLVGHTDGVTDCVFNPDGSLLATTSDDGTVRIWNAKTGEQLLVLDEVGAGFVEFDTSGNQLAIAIADGADSRVEMRDVNTGQVTLTLTGHEDDVNNVDFSKDGARIATASSDGTIRIWNTVDGEEQMRFGQESALFSVKFSPDDRLIAATGHDGRVKIWDIESGDLILTLAGHSNSIYFIAFSPDGKYLATASLDGTTKVWEISPEGNREWLTLVGHTNVVFSIDYGPDGKQISTSSWDGTAKVWDATTGENLLTLDDFSAEVARITYSPDGTKLATADYSGTVKVWEAATGKQIYTIQAHSPGDIDVTFSPNGKYLASGGSDNLAKLWDSDTGNEILSFPGHTDIVFSVAFSPDGNQLATASWDDTVILWDVLSGEQLLELSANAGDVNSVNFSPDGRFLVTTHEDGTARVWDISSTDSELGQEGRELANLGGHTNIVWDAAFSPDGERIATISFDGTARLWDAASGQELFVLPGNNNGPDLEFSLDGKFLATTSGEPSARVYVLPIEDLLALAHQRVSRSLTLEECQRYLHLELCPESTEIQP